MSRLLLTESLSAAPLAGPAAAATVVASSPIPSVAANLSRASWRHATQLVARIAERAGYRIRALPGRGWEVLATDVDFGDLVIQAAGRRS